MLGAVWLEPYIIRQEKALKPRVSALFPYFREDYEDLSSLAIWIAAALVLLFCKLDKQYPQIMKDLEARAKK